MKKMVLRIWSHNFTLVGVNSTAVYLCGAEATTAEDVHLVGNRNYKIQLAHCAVSENERHICKLVVLIHFPK